MIIEDCPSLWADRLTYGLKPPVAQSEQWVTFESGLRIHVVTSINHERGHVGLIYRWKSPTEDGPVVMDIALVPQEGLKRRWFFICPLSLDDKRCGRMASRIYIAKTKWFGCRYCQNLIYRSEQRDRRVSRLSKDPDQMRKALSNCKTIDEKRRLIDAYLLRKQRLRF